MTNDVNRPQNKPQFTKLTHTINEINFKEGVVAKDLHHTVLTYDCWQLKMSHFHATIIQKWGHAVYGHHSVYQNAKFNNKNMLYVREN